MKIVFVLCFFAVLVALARGDGTCGITGLEPAVVDNELCPWYNQESCCPQSSSSESEGSKDDTSCKPSGKCLGKSKHYWKESNVKNKMIRISLLFPRVWLLIDIYRPFVKVLRSKGSFWDLLYNLLIVIFLLSLFQPQTTVLRSALYSNNNEKLSPFVHFVLLSSFLLSLSSLFLSFSSQNAPLDLCCVFRRVRPFLPYLHKC